MSGESSDPFIGRNFGNYRALSFLDKGGFGAVYMGQHIYLTDRVVAIKVLRALLLNTQEEQAAFIQEAKFLEKLKYKHILSIHDVGIQDNVPYLVTSYAEKGSLRKRLNRQPGKSLPLEEALTILTQVGQALDYAHKKNIIHRDLKPENILFNANRDALLADFGIAKVLTTTSVKYTDVAGTPAYMAPEVFRGEASKASDQYSLGCIAYELLTSRGPFSAPDFVSMGFMHSTQFPVPLRLLHPQLPVYIEQAILKAMAKERKDRYPDVATFIAALQPQAYKPTPPNPQRAYVAPPPPNPHPVYVAPPSPNPQPVYVVSPPPNPQRAYVAPPPWQPQVVVDTTDDFYAITTQTKKNAGRVYLAFVGLAGLAFLLLRGNTNLAVAVHLAYLVFSIIALIVQYRIRMPNRLVRFHTMQSVLLGGGGLLLWWAILIEVISHIDINSNTTTNSPFFVVFSVLIFSLYVFLIITALVVMIRAYGGHYVKLPYLWRLAEKFAEGKLL